MGELKGGHRCQRFTRGSRSTLLSSHIINQKEVQKMKKNKTTAQANKDYGEEATAQAWKIWDETRAQAWKIFEEAIEKAWKNFEEDMAQANKEDRKEVRIARS